MHICIVAYSCRNPVKNWISAYEGCYTVSLCRVVGRRRMRISVFLLSLLMFENIGKYMCESNSYCCYKHVFAHI